MNSKHIPKGRASPGTPAAVNDPAPPGRRYRARGVAVAVALAAGLSAAPAFSQVMLVEEGGSVDLGAGNLTYDCESLQVGGELLTTQASIDGTGLFQILSAGRVEAGSSIFQLDGNWSNSGEFIPGSSSVTLTGACNNGQPVRITGDTEFCELNLTGPGPFQFDDVATINCSLNCNGNRITGSTVGGSGILLDEEANITGCDNTDIPILRIGEVKPVPVMTPLGLAILSMLFGLLAGWKGFFNSSKTGAGRSRSNSL